MIRIEHLRKEYPTAVPLKDVNVEIHKGDVISVIGPSGTGKSTLIRCINMLEQPTSGKIFVDGEEITEKGCDVARIRRKMGMVFQHFNLFPHMTVIENIMSAPMDLLGKSKQEAYDKGIELLRKVGLADKALNYPDVMSGGQKQRVAIARTLAMEPEIILFDEPTSALDPTMIGEVQAVIRDLAKQGTTMIIVTHEMKFAREICNRVFYMDQGGIYEDGPPEQIFDAPIKERTRQFIRHLKVLEYTITSADFDFIGFNTQIEEFGRKHRISQRTIYNIQAYIEEMCVQIILSRMKAPFEILVTIEYSEEHDDADVMIRYSGEAFDPTQTDNELSMLLAERATESIIYRYEPEEKLGNIVEAQIH
ncbi:MAG: amino acid ABC transporter ATP-binding protein [Oscillospiraceae bacterium]|nr:amino acid ABC transporter ATP-binding protein [Oscillospiraceae bacterium]